MDKILKTHSFNFNPRENGGESLHLHTQIYSNGDPGGIYLNQELTLESYGNSATFNLCGTVFTVESLRQLANELEQEIVQAQTMTVK